MLLEEFDNSTSIQTTVSCFVSFLPDLSQGGAENRQQRSGEDHSDAGQSPGLCREANLHERPSLQGHAPWCRYGTRVDGDGSVFTRFYSVWIICKWNMFFCGQKNMCVHFVQSIEFVYFA